MKSQIGAFQRVAVRAALSFFLALVGSAAFGASQDDLQRDLKVARSVWAERGLSAYEFTVVRMCACTPSAANGPIRVTVKKGKVVRSIYMGRLSGVSGRDVAGKVPVLAVPELFEEIAGRLAVSPSKASEFVIEYDPHDGHPTRYEFDDAGGDDFFSVVVSEFRAL